MERNLNALLVYILTAILIGAFLIEIFADERPCVLCFLERLGMIGVAIGALMNCRLGPHKLHYGLSILSALFGGAVALRQIALHICPGFPVFGKSFWGLNLYTWSFLIFSSSIIYIALLLISFDQSKKSRMNLWCRYAFFAAFGVTVANIIFSFSVCGWGTC
ncbi:MAG: disulfide bond formation protein B [Chlamydiales bacterium]